MSPIEWVVILVSLTSGTLGALGIGSYIYFRDRAHRRQRQDRQEQHLARLQRLTAKLLNALDRLLGGSMPEETILYHRFKAHGGEYYTDIQVDVIDTLRHGQSALNAAFELHRQLIKPDTPQNRPLEQKIWNWELLYATLVGHSDRIHNMTGDEVRVLLDPMVDPDHETEPNELVAQLDELMRELAGQPLKVKWQQIHPAQINEVSLLDYINQTKSQLAHLSERHKQEAPYWLAEARYQRQQAEAEVPPYLAELYRYLTDQTEIEIETETQLSNAEQTKAQLFADVDRHLAQAAAAQTQGEFLIVIEQAHQIWQDMDVMRAFLRGLNVHGRQRARIEAITGQGYRCPNLSDDFDEIKVDIETINRHIMAGNYANAAPWITELNTDSQRALTDTEAWQAMHHQNIANLDHLREQIDEAVRWRRERVDPAWQQLQAYPSQNWSDIATGVEQACQTLHRLQQEQVDQIESLNSMELQEFAEAERMLVYARVDLNQIDRQFQTVTNRLAEVQAAETRLPEAIRLTETDLARAETLRNQEDVKIGPEVDRQIEQANQHLVEARQLIIAGEFIRAVNEQTMARQFATAAYIAANEQVREINTLQAQLRIASQQVKEKTDRCQMNAYDLAAVVQTVSTSRLARQLQDEVSEAEQARLAATELEDRAMTEALLAAVEAYDKLNQQAAWVIQQLAIDQAEYDDLLSQTLTALAEAQEAIRQAQQTLLAQAEANAAGAGQHALKRAQSALPADDETRQATRQALNRIRGQAEEATRYARLAENQGRWQNRMTQARQNLRQSEQDRPTKRRLRRLSDRTEETSS